MNDKTYMGLVAELGCIICRNNGHLDSPAEIHHIGNDNKSGVRGAYFRWVNGRIIGKLYLCAIFTTEPAIMALRCMLDANRLKLILALNKNC